MFYKFSCFQIKIIFNNLKISLFTLFRFVAIKVLLRGKAHNEWKMMIQNEKRTVKDEELFIDDRSVIFGNGMYDNLLSTNNLCLEFDTL